MSETTAERHAQIASGRGRGHPGLSETACVRECNTEEIERSIPRRFEEEVVAHPGRLAFRSRMHNFTYGALNAAANRLAHAIIARRGTTEEPVALLFEHEASMLTAMLGAMKAGKFYVPLDGSHPVARNRYIVEDSHAELIITDRKNLASAGEIALQGCQVMDVDALDGRSSDDNPNVAVRPDTLTWILYTSGSTGQPKGVVQTHRNVMHFTQVYTNGLRVCADDRLSLAYSFCTNAAAHEIFTALLNGASLFPLRVKDEGVARLADWLVQNDITILSVVPTVFRHLCKVLTGRQQFPHLRLIKLVGELVYAQDADSYRRYFPKDCVLVNRFGSTETGTVRWYFIEKDTPINGSLVPVGYAVEDNDILLMNQTVEDDGSRTGEIAVKSRFLSPGYWRRPDLSSAAFLPDPDGGDARIFRTGDLGRMLPDGCLVHLGRKDFQVKIKGHRIEAGEVEMALTAMATVKEAAVVATKGEAEDQRLVAYVVPAGEQPPTVTALRQALAATLPAYMIPSVFVILDALPKAPNGKVSLGALPAPGRSRPGLDNPMVPPRTPVEATVCAIWSDVLELDEVGVFDDFLELGGHSLTAGQIVARIAEEFHVDLPVATPFNTPTVEGMVAAVVAGLGCGVDGTLQERLLTEVEALSDTDVARRLACREPEAFRHPRD